MNITQEQNPLKGAVRWEHKPSKLRISRKTVTLTPTLEEDEEGIERVAFSVQVNEQAAGFILFDEDEEKFFHLEPNEDEDLVRRGNKPKLETCVLNLLATRFPEHYQLAVLDESLPKEAS